MGRGTRPTRAGVWPRGSRPSTHPTTNAGGVTVSYFEWVQDIQQLMWSEDQVNHKLRELMLRAFHQMLKVARTRKLSMRTAALSMGVEKVAREKMRRGLFP